jgi:hypothetical protein
MNRFMERTLMKICHNAHDRVGDIIFIKKLSHRLPGILKTEDFGIGFIDDQVPEAVTMADIFPGN